MIHGDLSVDLLRTIFTPKSALHDGAVIVRASKVLAAGAVLPLAETTVHPERFGTRHRAALGVTEQTDAVVVVVSEENGQISLVQRARIIRNVNEVQLARAVRDLLRPAGEQSRIRAVAAGLPAPNRAGLGRLVRAQGRDAAGEREPALPPEELMLPAGATAETQLVRPSEDGRAARLDDRAVAHSTRSGITVRSPDVGPRDEAAARSAGTGR